MWRVWEAGFLGGPSGKESTCQCRRHVRSGLDPWIRKIPWRRARQPTPAFLLGESHGQRSLEGHGPESQRVRQDWSDLFLPWKSHGRRRLVGCSPGGGEESDTTERLHLHALEQEMATHSSVLAWRIPGTGEPGGLPSMGSHRVRHDWSDLAAAATRKKTTILSG